MEAILTNLQSILVNSGFAQFFVDGGYRYVIMIIVACVLLYLAIVPQFEPLLLLPIGFGMLMPTCRWTTSSTWRSSSTTPSTSTGSSG